MNLSKGQLKKINQLRQKKYRISEQLFVAEGVKVVDEFLSSKFVLEHLYCTSSENYAEIKNKTVISEVALKKISTLKSPNQVLAIFKIPKEKPFESKGLMVGLDGINDPGNMGTIIRLCDWFGIEQLICSSHTVDCYNPKVVQSTMGSLSRINIHYVDDFPQFLKKIDLPIFTTAMDGTSVYTTSLPENGVLVMGNEANGVSKEVMKIATSTISIPRFGTLQATESLNVATATAILLSEFRRGSELKV
ncbi:MAG: RNA methyltransferase [Flavobacteriaceae bacterium]|nr:RNA methyltransferase [Flavobacteriaceae bacterium]